MAKAERLGGMNRWGEVDHSEVNDRSLRRGFWFKKQEAMIGKKKERTVRIMPTLEGGKETAGGGGRRKAPGGVDPWGGMNRWGEPEEAFIVKRLKNKKQ